MKQIKTLIDGKKSTRECCGERPCHWYAEHFVCNKPETVLPRTSNLMILVTFQIEICSWGKGVVRSGGPGCFLKKPLK